MQTVKKMKKKSDFLCYPTYYMVNIFLTGCEFFLMCVKHNQTGDYRNF